YRAGPDLHEWAAAAWWREPAPEEHAAQGPDERRGIRAQGDLLAPPAGGGPEPRDGAGGARADLLQPEALRPGARGALQAESAPRPRYPGRAHGPHAGGLHHDHPLPHGAARGAGLHR